MHITATKACQCTVALRIKKQQFRKHNTSNNMMEMLLCLVFSEMSFFLHKTCVCFDPRGHHVIAYRNRSKNRFIRFALFTKKYEPFFDPLLIKD